MHLSCLPFLYKTLKSSRDGFNVLGNFNVSGIKTAISFSHKVKYDRPGECSPEKDCLR